MTGCLTRPKPTIKRWYRTLEPERKACAAVARDSQAVNSLMVLRKIHQFNWFSANFVSQIDKARGAGRTIGNQSMRSTENLDTESVLQTLSKENRKENQLSAPKRSFTVCCEKCFRVELPALRTRSGYQKRQSSFDFFDFSVTVSNFRADYLPNFNYRPNGRVKSVCPLLIERSRISAKGFRLKGRFSLKSFLSNMLRVDRNFRFESSLEET